jgi:hypothetical protein
MGELKYKDIISILLQKNIPLNMAYPYLMRISPNTINIIDEKMDFQHYVWTGFCWKKTDFIVPSDFSDEYGFIKFYTDDGVPLLYTKTGWKNKSDLAPGDFPDEIYSKFLSHIPKISYALSKT